MELKKEITKELLAESFYELMLTHDFEKITIKMITDSSNVIRPTFYYYFQDKYDLLEWIMVKKIFENTSYNLNFVVLPSGVVYYNPAIDINSISRDTLTQYMEKSNSKTINIDNSSYLLHSSKVKGIENFSIGILELNVPIVQKYLKYVLLLILSSSYPALS